MFNVLLVCTFFEIRHLIRIFRHIFCQLLVFCRVYNFGFKLFIYSEWFYFKSLCFDINRAAATSLNKYILFVLVFCFYLLLWPTTFIRNFTILFCKFNFVSEFECQSSSNIPIVHCIAFYIDFGVKWILLEMF